MMKKLLLLGCWLCAGWAWSDALPIFVSIVPQVYFVEQVGGDRVDVQALVQPGDSPATYDPNPRQMAQLSKAALYFRIGVPFESAFLPKISQFVDNLTIVDTRKGIELLEMDSFSDDHDDHDHHGDKDPHIWTDPMLVKQQIRTIADALIAVDPDGTAHYEENYRSFAVELDALNEQLKKTLEPARGRAFMVFHPSWGYFAHAYDLIQVPIAVEGKNPSARQLTRIIDLAKKDGISVIFVQPQFSQRAASSVAKAIHGKVMAVDPLAYDYMENLQKVAETIAQALQDPK